LSSPDQPAPDSLEAGKQRIRDAAKWLVASAAAVGAALIAGSQVSSIGRLDVGWPTTIATARLWVATIGVLTGLGGIAYVFWTAVSILLPSVVLISDLNDNWERPSREMRPVVAFFRRYPKYLQGVATPAQLIDHRARLIEQLGNAGPLAGEAFLPRISALDQRIQAIEDMANYQGLKARFERALGRLLAAAALIAIGIVAFAWSANPPAGPVTADLRNAKLGGAFLRDTDLRGARLDGADLSRADLTGADLTGATLTGVTWSATTCPDGSNSDENGQTCAGHLKPG
jgi:hypothetical protein